MNMRDLRVFGDWIPDTHEVQSPQARAAGRYIHTRAYHAILTSETGFHTSYCTSYSDQYRVPHPPEARRHCRTASLHYRDRCVALQCVYD